MEHAVLNTTKLSLDCNTLFFRCILISRFSYVENSLHGGTIKTNFIIKIPIVLLHITKNIAYHITEVLIFYADKLMVMSNSKNLCVFNFTILLKS